MTNDFWTEVEETYSKVARLPERERELLLNRYSPQADIRREVESLLQFQEAADGFNPSTILAAATNLFTEDSDEIIGSVVAGKYLVRQRLGAGHMAEVY